MSFEDARWVRERFPRDKQGQDKKLRPMGEKSFLDQLHRVLFLPATISVYCMLNNGFVLSDPIQRDKWIQKPWLAEPA